MTGNTHEIEDGESEHAHSDGTDTPIADTEDNVEEIRGALTEIRRESHKASFIYASLDAVCVLLVVYFAVSVAGVSSLNAAVAARAFDSLSLPLPAPDIGTLLALFAGGATFGGEFALRSRRPVAEQFEAANPEVSEALRTARDAADADRTNPMAQALYADVLDRLRGTSSVGLVNSTRLVLTVLLAVGLSAATVQTAIVGIDLGAQTAIGPDSGGYSGEQASANLSDDSLKNGDEVLGDPTNVSAGSENLTAEVGGSPGGDGQREWDYDSNADDGRDDAAVEAERAGFASPERVEDAALVERYARKLEGSETEDDNDE